MPTVIVDVMPKTEILDPQGQAVAGALRRLGLGQFTAVRQGKRFELSVEGEVSGKVLAAARTAAETLLSNPVIEDVVSVRAGHDTSRAGDNTSRAGDNTSGADDTITPPSDAATPAALGEQA